MAHRNISHLRKAVEGILVNSFHLGVPSISWEELDTLVDCLGIDRAAVIKKEARTLLAHLGNHTANDVFRVLNFIENRLLPERMLEESLLLLQKVPEVKEGIWMGDVMARVHRTLLFVLEKNPPEELVEQLKVSWRKHPFISLRKLGLE